MSWVGREIVGVGYVSGDLSVRKMYYTAVRHTQCVDCDSVLV